MATKRFTALISYSYDPARWGKFTLSFDQPVRKDVRERLVAECGGEWSDHKPVLLNVPEGQQGRAQAIVEKAYPHASISLRDSRPVRHAPDCRIAWSKSDDWYSARIGWLGHVAAFESTQTTSRTDPEKYRVITKLPGFSREGAEVARGETQLEAELRAEEAVLKFVRRLQGSLSGLF